MTATWIELPAGSAYGVDNLPMGVAVSPRFPSPQVVARIGDQILAMGTLGGASAIPEGDWMSRSLNGFLARGPAHWAETRAALQQLLTDEKRRAVVELALYPIDDVILLLPMAIADYVDFYASEHHAGNLGRMLRPGEPALMPNWRHLPVGYHGRSGTIVVSGTPIRRPSGQLCPSPSAAPVAGPTERLDVEVEVGFVVGAPSRMGEPVPVSAFAEHVFGVCLVNDWSARDIQAWEYRPLGPFLGKSFATSMSAWVVPLAALQQNRVPVGSAEADLLPYLREKEPWGLDISLELAVNGEVLSRPPYASMYWSPAQMLAHLTRNGASVRTGDLYASGTVSGPEPDQVGSLIERWDNSRFLADGDEVVITATAPGRDGTTIGFGEVSGKVVPV